MTYTLPRILILGPDGIGKDTFAYQLIANSACPKIPFREASRIWAESVPEWDDGRDLNEWWEARRSSRPEWIRAAKELCANDPIKIARLVYAETPIYTGCRRLEEIDAILAADCVRPAALVWVTRQRERYPLTGLNFTLHDLKTCCRNHRMTVQYGETAQDVSRILKSAGWPA